MKTSIQTYVGLRARIRHTFTVNSSAQEAPKPPQLAAATEEQPQEIVVGIRAAIESAIATKRQSDELVEAISAENIGKLPGRDFFFGFNYRH